MNYSNQLILRSSFARLPVCPLKCGGGWWLKKKKFLKGLTICKCEVKVVEVKSWCNFCASWQLHCTMSQVGVFLPSLFFFFFSVCASCFHGLWLHSEETSLGATGIIGSGKQKDWRLKIAEIFCIFGGGGVSEHSGLFLSFFFFFSFLKNHDAISCNVIWSNSDTFNLCCGSNASLIAAV